MKALERIRHQLKHGLMTRSVLLRLAKLGLDLTPYVLYREGEFTPAGLLDETYRIEPITPDNLDYIVKNFPSADFSAAAWGDRLSLGQLGLLIMRGDDMVGYSWADTRECSLGPRKLLFALQDGQAYLRYTFVTKAFRGKGLAPLLRQRMYAHLGHLGYKELFSVSEFFNRPAKNFKKKLAAIPLELRLSLLFLGRWGFDIRLRKYDANAGGSLVPVLKKLP